MSLKVNLIAQDAIVARCRDRGIEASKGWVRGLWERGALKSVIINKKRHSRVDHVDQLIEGFVRQIQ